MFIKKITSKKKRRYTDSNFNLDLSYITPRVIAMAYPASGMESNYRNNIKDVSFVLQHKFNVKMLMLGSKVPKYAT